MFVMETNAQHLILLTALVIVYVFSIFCCTKYCRLLLVLAKTGLRKQVCYRNLELVCPSSAHFLM